MSDVMLFGVLRMPFDLAMGDHLAQQQFYQRAQECADRLEKAEAALAALQQARTTATDANELQLKLVAIISSVTSLGEQRVYDLADSIMQTLPAAAAQQEPYGWLQFIDGVKTQNFARTQDELKNIKDMFRLMKHPGKAEYIPVFRYL